MLWNMENQRPNFFPGTVINYQNNEVTVEDKPVIEDTSLLAHNANILASQYEIVRNILRQLPMKELINCCTVCKLWRDIVDIVRKEGSRYDSTSFFWKGAPTDVSYYSQYPLFQSPPHKQVRVYVLQIVFTLLCTDVQWAGQGDGGDYGQAPHGHGAGLRGHWPQCPGNTRLSLVRWS